MISLRYIYVMLDGLTDMHELDFIESSHLKRRDMAIILPKEW
jgi:hypothetical protein